MLYVFLKINSFDIQFKKKRIQKSISTLGTDFIENMILMLFRLSFIKVKFRIHFYGARFWTNITYR